MERANLGKSGPRVSRIGLGCMGMSGMYGANDEAQAVATIRAVLPAAVRLEGDWQALADDGLSIIMAGMVTTARAP